jgi:peptidylprolyl isomerase
MGPFLLVPGGSAPASGDTLASLWRTHMSHAKSGDTVKIHYTGTLDDGSQFDSSSGRDPREFEVGSGQVIPGFDKAVEGMAVGDSKSVRIEAEDAYGQRHDQLVQEVDRSLLPEDLDPKAGMALQSNSPDGQVMQFMVTAVNEETVTVDANHPLAGQALSFDIELVDIK